MNRPEPIELENNLGPDAVTGEINRVPWMAYDVDEMDLYIAELEQKLAEKDKELESLKASHFEEMADAGMENRIMKRALWLARAERASDKARIFYFAMTENVDLNINGYSHKEKRHTRMLTARWWEITWLRVERKCRAKAEEYK